MTRATNRSVPDGPPTATTVATLPEVLTSEQAAWLLQLTPGRLAAAANRGELPSRKIGRQRLYSKTALIHLVVGDPGAEPPH